MNILPKKRWHVRTKANIERVRKDEAEAREREITEKRRIQISEREAKINFLRKKNAVNKNDISDQSQSADLSESVLGNLEQVISGRNKEHDEEEKKLKEEYEKKVGILSCLGKSLSEEKPWYLEERSAATSNQDVKKDPTVLHAKLDPLKDMKKYLAVKEKSDPKKQLHKKHGQLPSKHNKTDQKKSIESLRAERIQRERKERERAKQLLAACQPN